MGFFRSGRDILSNVVKRTSTPKLPPLSPGRAGSRVFTTESYKSPGAVVSPIPPYLSSGSTGGAAVAGLPKFEVLKGKSAPLDIQNIDTDMIIPKEVRRLYVQLETIYTFMSPNPNLTPRTFRRKPASS